MKCGLKNKIVKYLFLSTMFSTASVFLSATSNVFEISSFFVCSVAVSIMMSHVGHNVHNVTHRLLMMVEKAQFVDIVLR